MKTDNAANYGKFVAKGEVVFVRTLPAPIDLVWEYLTDADKRATWFAGGEMERFTGGKLELHFKHANLSDPGDDEAPAGYAEVAAGEGVKMSTVITGYEPPRLLSYTWESGEEPGTDSEVVFELEPLGDHTRLTLTHRKLADTGSEANVSTGWHLHLAFLEATLAGNTRPLLWKTHALLQKDYAEILGIDLSEVKSCH